MHEIAAERFSGGHAGLPRTDGNCTNLCCNTLYRTRVDVLRVRPVDRAQVKEKNDDMPIEKGCGGGEGRRRHYYACLREM